MAKANIESQCEKLSWPKEWTKGICKYVSGRVDIHQSVAVNVVFFCFTSHCNETLFSAVFSPFVIHLNMNVFSVDFNLNISLCFFSLLSFRSLLLFHLLFIYIFSTYLHSSFVLNFPIRKRFFQCLHIVWNFFYALLPLHHRSGFFLSCHYLCHHCLCLSIYIAQKRMKSPSFF